MAIIELTTDMTEQEARTVQNNNNNSILYSNSSGWIPLAGTFEFENATTVTTSIDCTDFLSAGMKFKCTNNGVEKIDTIRSVTSNQIILNGITNLKKGTITDVCFSTAFAPLDYTPADYPIECGTSGIWTWKKYASGIAECWGKEFLNNISITKKYVPSEGSMWFESDVLQTNYPTNLFVEAPYLPNPNTAWSTNWYPTWAFCQGNDKDKFKYFWACPQKKAGLGCWAYYRAIGRWKN